MDELDFYKKQYAFLMGEIDHAIEELDRHNHTEAKFALLSALSVAETRWINEFSADDLEKINITLESMEAAR